MLIFIYDIKRQNIVQMRHINDISHKTDEIQTAVGHVKIFMFYPGGKGLWLGGRFNVNKEMGHMCLSLFSQPNIRDYMEDL